jgi:cell shape-determining protein MreC
MLKMTSTKQQIKFHFKWLVLFIYLSLIIIPFTSNSQSHTYQLSNKTDSLIQFLSRDLAVPDRMMFLENLKNEKSEDKIRKLQDQLEKVEGNERLEMEFNERLGRESKWAGKVTEAYQYSRQ